MLLLYGGMSPSELSSKSPSEPSSMSRNPQKSRPDATVVSGAEGPPLRSRRSGSSCPLSESSSLRNQTQLRLDDPEDLPGGGSWKTSPILLCRLPFTSQLPLPLALLSTETAPAMPLPFTPAPANNQLKGHKAASSPQIPQTPPPHCLCVMIELFRDQTIKKKWIQGQLG